MESHVIQATYELSTPAFIAGARQTRAEFRIPSFKGALRFWWRACVAAGIGRVEDLRRREAELFGSAQRGRSRLSIRTESLAPRRLKVGDELRLPPRQHGKRAPRGGERVAYGARYLAYGVVEQGKSTLARQGIDAPWSVDLHMRLDPSPRRTTGSRHDAEPFDGARACREITRALIALGLFGGIGAKSRKGYGSLVLRDLRVDGEAQWSAPATAKDLAARIRELYRWCAIPTPRTEPGPETDSAPEPEWTALSRHARHRLVVPATGNAGPLELLDRVGRELVRFRSWGHKGKIFGSIDAERRFEVDHALAKGERQGCHPQRIAFGLPHNYGRDDLSVDPVAKELDRRASPLFIHVHQCGATPVAVLSFLPARFLPQDNDRVRLRRGAAPSQKVPLAQRPALWKPIHDFLDRMQTPKEPLRAVEGNLP